MIELMEFESMIETGVMTAAEMTHGLCDIGGGSMQAGIQAVIKHGFENGIFQGYMNGFKDGEMEARKKTAILCTACAAAGVIGTGLVVLGVNKRKKKRQKLAEDSNPYEKGKRQ